MVSLGPESPESVNDEGSDVVVVDSGEVISAAVAEGGTRGPRSITGECSGEEKDRGRVP